MAEAGSSPGPAQGASASILWMLLSALASASLAALAHALGPYIGWQGVLLSRTFFGLVFSLAAARATGAEIVLLGPRYLWLRSIAGGVGILLNFYAYTKLPIGDVLVLGNTAPLWFAAFAWWSLGHHPSRPEWIALGSGIVGVALVSRPHLQHGNLAVVAAAFTGITSAIALRALSRLRHCYRPATILVHHAGAALLTAMVLTALVPRPVSLGGLEVSRAAPALLLLGALGTLGQYASTRALASGRPARTGAVSYASVGFGVLFDHVLWPGPFDPRTLAGMVLILLPLGWLVRLPDQGLVVRASAFEGPPLALGTLDEASLGRWLAEAGEQTSCPIRIHAGGEGDARSASAMFAALGMERTALRNGALLCVAADGRRAAIAADKGIAEIVPAPELDRVCRALLLALSGGVPAGFAVERAVEDLGKVLGEYFPAG